VKGRTLADIRNYFEGVAARERDQVAALSSLSATLVGAAIAGAGQSRDVIIAGRSRLLDQPEFADSESFKQLMGALEEKEQLLRLLDLMLTSDRVQVFLGEQTTEVLGYPVTLVAAPYGDSLLGLGGAVGIIGPTRMDYPVLVPLVEATAKAMSAVFARRPALPSDDG
jgi:heat-inducible transcriptional repressor